MSLVCLFNVSIMSPLQLFKEKNSDLTLNTDVISALRNNAVNLAKYNWTIFFTILLILDNQKGFEKSKICICCYWKE